MRDLARNPQLQQPRYTTQNPKVHTGDPITGTSYPGLSRIRPDEVRKGFADYGHMLLSPSKPMDAYRNML